MTKYAADKLFAAAVSKIVEADPAYKRADTEGRRIIRRNVGTDIDAIMTGTETVDALVAAFYAARRGTQCR